MNKIVRLIVIVFLAFPVCQAVHAQCTAENTAFSAGEELSYDLFFNWKFIWLNAGTATMKISPTWAHRLPPTTTAVSANR